jgi:diguanylate cyclase (GGDEF)-like protein
VSRLRGIEGQISTAIQVDDIRVIRSQMADCLVEIRKETERQKTLASTAAERMRLDLDRARTGVTSDSVTGLQVRTKGMEMLTTACQTEQSAFAAVMVIDRLQHINATSGAEAGDQLLRYFAGHVRRNLPPADWLFRWTGASLLALLYRAKSLEKVREEMSQLMNTKLECTVRTATRSIRLPVTARWTLFPMMASPPALLQKIDEFAATLNVTD